ncbi:NfeD family protein [Marinilabilia sp.]|uniref:NfeD family protein n=1 Tax=Marinilabilia sp. TaxID=2021252 RepID=UPI0025BBB791|nr:NfeD family protein [Marinilabilia sp.]
MEILGMTINEILIVSAIILILVDIFFASDFPTHLAYIIGTFAIAKEIDMPILYQILFGVLIWMVLVVFHYTIWRKIIEKINDKLVAPSKHIGGLEGFIGKEGIIKEVEGDKYIFINDEIYQFETEKEIAIGNKYIVLNVKSNKLII